MAQTTKVKGMSVTLSDKDRRAISRVLGAAIECACGCNSPGSGSGYLGHDRCCYVHLMRDDLKRVAKNLGES